MYLEDVPLVEIMYLEDVPLAELCTLSMFLWWSYVP